MGTPIIRVVWFNQQKGGTMVGNMRRWGSALGVAAALLAWGTSPGLSIAAGKSTSPSGAQTAPNGQRLPSKVRFVDAPSSETPAARRKRLKRECKGRPDAGACRGFTR